MMTNIPVYEYGYVNHVGLVCSDDNHLHARRRKSILAIAVLENSSVLTSSFPSFAIHMRCRSHFVHWSTPRLVRLWHTVPALCIFGTLRAGEIRFLTHAAYADTLFSDHDHDRVGDFHILIPI